MYYTTYSLQIHHQDPSILDYIHAEQHDGFFFGFSDHFITKDKTYISTYKTVSGYKDTMLHDLYLLSTMYPGIVFTVRGFGEDPEDIWMKEFVNGDMKAYRGHVLYDYDKEEKKLNIKEILYKERLEYER